MDPLKNLSFSTVLDLLEFRAGPESTTANDIAFTYLADGHTARETITFADLDHRARNIATHLQSVARPGDRVLLLYPPGLEYITAFFGCIYAGVIAVPSVPPTNRRTLPRLQLIAKDAQANVALAPMGMLERLGGLEESAGDVLRQITWLSTDELPDVSRNWRRPSLQSSDIAFLQYTSGSTSAPKGVMVSHGNLLANVELQRATQEHATGLKVRDVLVSWLPPYHDFGLVTGILFPVFMGCHSVQFPPSVFLRRPYQWLKVLSDYRARMTGAPNFAYDLCVRKVSESQKQLLDLSALDLAINGAERIRYDTLRAFSEAFAQCGFKPGAFAPGYGLAESTLVVCTNIRKKTASLPHTLELCKTSLSQNSVTLSSDPSDTIKLVSHGDVNGRDHKVVIVDPSSLHALGDDRVGEIWVSGTSVAQGYWNRPEENQQTFSAAIAGQGDDRVRYLRTGDLGFIRNNALYVTGRIKEIMVFNGRNIYPQDIETTVERIDPAFRANGCAAFSLEDDQTSRLVIIQEVQSGKHANVDLLVQHLRADLAEQHEITDIAAIVLVKTGHIPRTSSGKIQRLRCKELFLSNSLSPVWSWEAAAASDTDEGYETSNDESVLTDNEIKLAGIWREVLDDASVSTKTDFFAAGGHSLAGMQLLSKVRAVFGIELSLRTLFEAPTIERFAQVIELVQRTASFSAESIPLTPRTRSLPLSWAQQRLWFLDQFDHAAGAAYHIPAALRLQGTLDKPALRATLDRIVARHECLRTTFANMEGEAIQVIAPADTGFALAERDLRALSSDEQEAAVRRIGSEEAAAPFDLSTGPLIRGQLLVLAENNHVLLLTQHHIVSDGWSIGVLVREVSALYTAFSQGLPDPLPALAIQYADYALWQRQWLQGEALARQTDFWRAQLTGAPALLELPTDRPRPTVQSFAGASVGITLSPELSAGLHAMAQRHGATLFMTLLTGWSILLARMSGQQDVVIGTPVANRQRTEIESLIGFFVNTLALRVRLDTDPSVVQLLDQIKHTTLDAYDHQDLPFEQVVEALNPVRSTSHSPLFQVLFSLDNSPAGGALALPGLTLSTIQQEHNTAQFDLALSLTDAGEMLTGALNYATDLFDRSTIERLAGHFQTLLASMVADDQQKVSQLALLSASERHRLLVEFNDTTADYPRDQLIHQLFEAQAARQADATALVFEERHLTYGELNRRANQVAHHLIALGVQPDDRVAICVKRSLELVVGLLGILKAGGAYVPLDPAYPADRLAYMLEDSAPVALLTQTALRDSVPPLQKTGPVLLLDADNDASILDTNPDPITLGLSSRNLAYVIYTSGSTGMPKGVMVEHANVVQLVINEPCVPIDPQDCMAYCANPTFDASTWEIWGALLNGAKLLIVAQSVLLDAAAFGDLLESANTSILQLTAGLFNQYAKPLAHVFPRLKYVLFGGDRCDIGSVIGVLQEASPHHLVHTYGPTETVAFTSTYEVHAVTSDACIIPIGRPIANSQIYLLDAHLQPVPLGVAGEIHIGGAGVARGYLNRPELTAERFIADPFSSDPEARLYKTGDVARYLPDGNIVFLGRNDFQVKIRGFRIELGEIEAKLATCEGVREALVIAREDDGGDKRLVAYLVAQDGMELSVEELRASLSAVLPEYMVPAAYVMLDVFPLTPNGKVDRKALPAPNQSSVLTRAYEAPQGEIEIAIADIWQDLLGLEQVGRHDHFFELGGHSLLAVQLVSRLRQALGIEIALRDLFAQPTLQAFSQLASRAARAELPPILVADRSGPLALSWAQQRLWFIDQFDHAAGAAYHIPAALRLQGRLDKPALRATLDRIVARHESLRTTFASVEGEAIQVIAPADTGFALAERDLSALAGDEQEAAVRRIGREEAGGPFDLSTGPLIRGQLLTLAENDHVLLLTQHHIISDGWSSGVLVREVSTLYTAFSQGLPDPLPALTIQYADYALWQRQWLQGEALAGQTDFWRAQLTGAPALLALPTDRPRPSVQSYAGASVGITLSSELSAGLRALAQRHGTTLFMTLLTGWSILLARMSGQQDVVIGTPVANRQRTEIESLIGFFVNTLALRVRLDADPSVVQLLDQIKHTTLDAYAHQDLPFEQVVEALKPVRSTSHGPLFQVLFSLDNTPAGGALALPGLTLSNIQQEHNTAQFDLALAFTDTGEMLTGALNYATDLFDRSTIERLAGHFQTLLASMVADDRQKVSRLALLSASERHQLLVEFNDTAADYPHDRLIHQLFEAQAARQADATALVFEEQRLTYGELNRRANQVAHRLIALGVKPDDRVAICVERSLEMVVGLLGILKAGGAYVPLDPAYPADRLAYMLQDCAPVALLTQTALRDSVPLLKKTGPVLLLDAGKDASILDTNPDPVMLGLSPHNLAYVIYTSGSTGLPKGVMVSIKSLVGHIQSSIVRYAINDHDRILQFSSTGFDPSIEQIFCAFLAGATLIARPRQMWSADQFITALSAHAITVANIPSDYFSRIYTEKLMAQSPLRLLIVGGGILAKNIAEKWRSACVLMNAYGPTETTITASTYVVQPVNNGVFFKTHTVPIGRPVANTRIYLLDAHLQPVPLGVTGEIHIGGAGVARGYLNRPELTAERFIADPFSSDPEARLYKTGDLARYLPDGNIEYLGRNDFQVKIRGFRIELGEIEARLTACAGVREALVIAREDDGGDKRLVAYVVAQDGMDLSVAELRNHLSAVLPEYMVPAAYVMLDVFPLTPNGKIDRNALPAPDQSSVLTRPYEAPQGETEIAMAQIWQELLGLAQVGRHDHFFELGGHSLLVVTLIERLRQRGLHTDVRTLFTSPRLSDLAAVVEADRGHQAQIVPPNRIPAACTAVTPDMLPLVTLSQDEIDRIAAGVPQGAANIQDIYPLAPLQEGILFHHLLETEGDTYILRSVIGFDSRHHLDRFLTALQAVIDRHDILRTAIAWTGLPQAVQVVHRQAPLPIVELALTPERDTQQQLLEQTDPRRLRLDLQKAPLLAAYVAQDPHSGECLLSLLSHHMVADHLTLELIVTEVQALLQGRPDLLPAALHYRNFIAQTLAVPVSEHEAYFRRQLGDVDEPTAPFGLLNVQDDGSLVSEARLTLAADLASRIRLHARQQGVTPAVLFHTAWAQVLAKCCGRDDVVFGTLLTGRLQGSEGADRVLGMFINTLPVRITLAGLSVQQAVAHAYRQLGGLLEHEQTPLALAQRCSGVAPGMPLFTALLNYRHSAGVSSPTAWEGMRVLGGEERTNYPLALSVDDLGQGFAFTALCAEGIDPARMVAYLRTAMEGLVDALAQDPQRQVGAIDILPAAERHQLLVEFNDTAADYASDQLIHQLFEAQAARQADATALVFEDQSLTYGELNRRANQLAHHLIAQGVKPDDRVAICVKRSLEMVVGVLGILKAGGAYVPLDPAYPGDRLAYMLEDSAPVALLTQTALRDRVPLLQKTGPVLLLDGDASILARQPDTNPDPIALGLSSRNLAYVIYTSGSTGMPKGVMNQHGGLCNLAQVQIDLFAVKPTSHVLQFASFSFDASVFEFVMALCSGARLYLATADMLLPGDPLLRTLQDYRITHVTLPTAALTAMDDTDGPGTVESLIVAGDTMPSALAGRFADRHRLFNAYGPTETTVCATTYRCGPDHDASVPIGRPIANAQIYLLDAHLQPVPLGVTGEIHIGGAGVARGYLNRPDLTAERFIADPFGGDPEGRLYKTGDLARYLPDGNIVFLGRNDFQVKIRGFRIELGEIEARLVACEGVREALVVARGDDGGDKRLVAYVVAKDGMELSVAELRDNLSAVLPDYMVPAAYVMLDVFPLTPNGKIDRKALPAPDESSVLTRAYEAPQGETEIAIAQIWQDLLGLAQVGRHDHFFELGGHSLVAVQLVSRLRQVLGIEVALRDLFAQPTLQAFSQLASHAARAELPPILVADRSEPLALSWAQQRLWFLDQFDRAASAAYHLPAALRLQGTLDKPALRATLDRIVARHEGLRTTFASVEGEAIQVIAPADTGFALVERDLSALAGDEQEAAVRRIGSEEATAPFDLSAGPLIRGQLLTLAENDHVLLLTQHHIISDGWSMGILVREVFALYTAFSQGMPDPLPALTIQYADYALWQRQWLQGEALARQTGFWRAQLTGAPGLLELPTDRPRPPVQSHAGASVGITLSSELSAGVRALAQRHGATLFMTLLAGWSILLARMSGQQDVVIGTPVANRQRTEIESLIGFFVNTLALRVRLDADPSVVQLLDQIKHTTLDAYAHQDLPFEQVVEALKPVRSTSHSPLFQVLFSLDNTPTGGALALPGLTLSTIQQEQNSAQFDLALSLTDAGEMLTGALTYATDLFDRSTVERLAGHFQTLLASMVAGDQRKVSQLALLSASERHRLLVEFNDTAADYPHDRLIHQLFEAQAARQADATALVFEEQSLTYGELNRRANQVAHHLIALGVKPDDRIAICVERSLEMVVGLLGILKAGGAYVPLDPAYPADRLAYMLQDSAPAALLTQAALKDDLPVSSLLQVVVLDEANDQASILAQQPDTNPDPIALGLSSGNLAYVIYTSGSTGQPKGIAVEHRSLMNLAQALVGDVYRDVADPAGLRVGLNASFAFDASLQQIVMLGYGATLFPVPEEVRLDADRFAAAIADWRLDAFDCTPSQLALLLDSPRYTVLPRYVLVGGEAISAPLWDRLAALADNVIYNVYGPTEATVDTIVCRIDAQSGKPHIGRPIANTQVYILDPNLEPVAPGVAGELYIAGAALARGYLNQAGLHTDRFLPNPFSEAPGARMFRTGDLARYLSDGNIEYLGRNDFQVKIRGFRIELGEIEAKLATCEGVREALVVAREDDAGDKRLVAYLVAQDGMELSVAELRANLSAVLPDYMVPAAFVTLDVFPLTPNGKIDRNALPAPDESSVLTRTYEAPQGETEIAIARIWQDLLGLEQVGRHDHFFELGGHSLLAISLIERLRQHGLHTNVRTLFTTPNLAGLAEAVASNRRQQAFIVPPNRIPAACTAITPDMLPLVTLSQDEIDRIAAGVPQGAANIQDIYPLVSLQEGILFHHLLETEGDAYIVRSVITFDSRHYLDRFLTALQAVIDRHDILRTAIVWAGLPQAVQVVYRQAPLPIVELALTPEGDTQQQLLDQTDPRRLRLDLGRAPILAAYVAQDPHSGEYLLSLLSHHIVADHITLELTVTEVQALLQGRPDLLPPALPYRNFIAQTLAVPVSEHEAYFRRQLGDVDEPTAPFGLLNVQGDGGLVSEARLTLDADLASRIRLHAREQGVTPAVLFHTAWAQVLAKCCGRDDVVFGTLLTGRLQGWEGADRVLGMFVNTLPVRITLAGLSVQQAVAHAYRQLGGLLEHEQASLALAQRCSGVAPGMPLFTALLNYRRGAGALWEEGNAATAVAWEGMRVQVGEERTNYPMALVVDDLGQDFALTAQGVEGIDPMRIAAYLHTAMEGLVDALAQDPQRQVSAIDILPAAERHQLLVEFNDTAADYPRDQLIHQLVEAQAARQADATALVFEERHLSYGELNRRANQVAHHLIALGVKPDDRVAICVERSLEMVVGLLGILKAGGAYMPLDPAYPADRLAYMLQDSAPVALLTQAALEDDIPVSSLLQVVVLDEAGNHASMLARQPDTNPDPHSLGLSPRNLAYVIYTSGSTGLPKGVMVEHRNLANLIQWHCVSFDVTDKCRSSSVAGLAFDASIWEMWPVLHAGGALRLAPPAFTSSPSALLEWWRHQHVDVSFLPTPLAEFAFNEGITNKHLRTLLIGGDRLRRPPPSTQFSLVNNYGPTEGTVVATSGKQEAHAPVLHIGRPIANTQVYLLDAHLQPVPLGVAGEIHIGGAGVARGYLNRPELTAERFIADPFGSDPEGRLYKTGDLARYLPDGNIEYLGRNDFQVKIRGFRIELGEIEAELSACEGVREALVIAREDAAGDKRLVAYLVAQDGMEPSVAELRDNLSAVLPDYMVPAAFVMLDVFPLTPNGKIDRKALPAPDQASVLARAYEEPQGETEIAIAQVWQDLLGLEQVGRHDHFFELGGHSLMAVQLLSRVRQQFGVEVSLANLFEKPVLIDFADLLVSLQIELFSDEDIKSELASLSENELKPC